MSVQFINEDGVSYRGVWFTNPKIVAKTREPEFLIVIPRLIPLVSGHLQLKLRPDLWGVLIFQQSGLHVAQLLKLPFEFQCPGASDFAVNMLEHSCADTIQSRLQGAVWIHQFESIDKRESAGTDFVIVR